MPAGIIIAQRDGCIRDLGTLAMSPTNFSNSSTAIELSKDRSASKSFRKDKNFQRNDGTCKEKQEDRRFDQFEACARYEVWQRYEAFPNLHSHQPGPDAFLAVTLGYKSTLKTLRSGKAKLVIIAGNTPPLRKVRTEIQSL